MRMAWFLFGPKCRVWCLFGGAQSIKHKPPVKTQDLCKFSGATPNSVSVCLHRRQHAGEYHGQNLMQNKNKDHHCNVFVGMNAQCVDADVVLPSFACVKNTVYVEIRSLVPGNKSCSLKPIHVSLAVHATAQMWPELNVVMFECICRILFLFCHNHEKVVTGSNSSVPYVGLGLTATNEIMKQNTAD